MPEVMGVIGWFSRQAQSPRGEGDGENMNNGFHGIRIDRRGIGTNRCENFDREQEDRDD